MNQHRLCDFRLFEVYGLDHISICSAVDFIILIAGVHGSPPDFWRGAVHSWNVYDDILKAFLLNPDYALQLGDIHCA